jgi:hypothetical protein
VEEPVLRVGGWVPAHRAVEPGPADGPLASVEHPLVEVTQAQPVVGGHRVFAVPGKGRRAVGLVAALGATVVAFVAVVRLTGPAPVDWSAQWWPGWVATTEANPTDVPPPAPPLSPAVFEHTEPAPSPRPARPSSPPTTAGTIAVASPSPSPAPPQVLSYEAESALLSPWTEVRPMAGASGERIVGDIGNGSFRTVRFTVTVPVAGEYPVTVHYLAGQVRIFTISVNGAMPHLLTCASTGGWTTVGTTVLTLDLVAGANSLQFGNPFAWAPDLDRITVTVPSP